jgi:hypothetical protein
MVGKTFTDPSSVSIMNHNVGYKHQNSGCNPPLRRMQTQFWFIRTSLLWVQRPYVWAPLTLCYVYPHIVGTEAILVYTNRSIFGANSIMTCNKTHNGGCKSNPVGYNTVMVHSNIMMTCANTIIMVAVTPYGSHNSHYIGYIPITVGTHSIMVGTNWS